MITWLRSDEIRFQYKAHLFGHDQTETGWTEPTNGFLHTLIGRLITLKIRLYKAKYELFNSNFQLVEELTSCNLLIANK